MILAHEYYVKINCYPMSSGLFSTHSWIVPTQLKKMISFPTLIWFRVETEQQKHRSRAFRALKFSIWAISSIIFDFEFSIRAISSGKMVEHFEHRKILSDHREISSISPEKNFEQNRAFFERNQTFFEHDRAESTVNTNFYNIFQVVGIPSY